MEKKIKIKTLNILITKDCNLECKHCMRGDHSRDYISYENLDRLLSQVREIEFLSITGGEPFLAPSQIAYIVNYIRQNNIKVDTFSIVTNGTIYNMKILNDLANLAKITSNSKYIGNTIGISEDRYHNQEIEKLGITSIRDKNHILIEKFCARNNIIFKVHNIADALIVKEGRGKDISSFHNRYINYSFDADKIHQDTMEYDGDIIIDPDGFIFLSSESSYETIRKLSIGNIKETDLETMLLKQYEECLNKRTKLLFKN